MNRFILPLVLCLFASPAWAALAYVTSATGTETGTDADVSLSIDVGAGTNRLLLCAVEWNLDSLSISSVQHNAVDLTQIAGPVCSGGYCIDLWQLVAPASGSLSVVATLSNTGASKIITCMAFSGVDQGTPSGTPATYDGYDNPITATVTIPANGMGMAMAIFNDETNAGSYTVDANSTKRYDIADTDLNFAAVGSTTGTSGDNAQTISNPGINYAAMIVLPINAAAGAPATTRRMLGAIVF